MPEDDLGKIALKGAEECERTVQSAIALDTAFLLDMQDDGHRFWGILEAMYVTANKAREIAYNGGLTVGIGTAGSS